MIPLVQRKVLVVEDDPVIRKLLCFALHTAGFEVAEAGTGDEALLSLAASLPDAVVLDLTLPDDKSGAVLEWLRQKSRQGSARLSWVVTSALPHEEAARRYGTLGGPFLPKPFDPWDLINRLEGLTGPCIKG